MLAGGPPEPDEAADLAERYGLEFGEPPWLPDVIDAIRPHPAPRTAVRPQDGHYGAVITAVQPLTDVQTWLRGSGLEILLIISGAILLARAVGWIGETTTGRIDCQRRRSPTRWSARRPPSTGTP